MISFDKVSGYIAFSSIGTVFQRVNCLNNFCLCNGMPLLQIRCVPQCSRICHPISRLIKRLFDFHCSRCVVRRRLIFLGDVGYTIIFRQYTIGVRYKTDNNFVKMLLKDLECFIATIFMCPSW